MVIMELGACSIYTSAGSDATLSLTEDHSSFVGEITHPDEIKRGAPLVLGSGRTPWHGTTVWVWEDGVMYVDEYSYDRKATPSNNELR